MKEGKKIIILWVTAILTLVFDIQPVKAVDWWPMFRHDPNHTGYSTSTAPDTNNVLWGYNICNWYGCSVESSPAVADGKVYVGSQDNKVYCLNAYTGAVIWSYTTYDHVDSSPALAYGNVYVGSNDNWVYCLPQNDPNSDGVIDESEVLWRHDTGNNVSSPTVVDGKVYVGSKVNNVYCLNAFTGAPIWVKNIGEVECSPAVADGKVYVGTNAGRLYCLNASNGEPNWIHYTGGEVRSSPAVADGKVYVAATGGTVWGKLYCLNALTGARIWVYDTGTETRSSPAVAYDKVYIGAGYKIYCLPFDDPNSDGVIDDSEVIWSYTTGGNVWSSPAVADGKVYVGSHDCTVYCLDAEGNGSGTTDVIWSYTTSSWVRSSPAIAYGNVYVGKQGTWGPELYAFGPTSMLTVTKTDGGTTDPPPGNHSYASDSFAQVTATPDSDYVLDYWELDGSDVNSANPYSVLMDDDHTLHAVFVSVPTIPTIPTVSEWGLIIMAVLLLTAGAIVIRRRRRAAA